MADYTSTFEESPPEATCFAKGTWIATAQGEVRIEALQPGALVRTATGGFRPLRWIGWRQVDLSRLAGSRRIGSLPILIRANALADRIPYHDLVVSARHGVMQAESLHPAGALVNGGTIAALTTTASIAYYHLEFDQLELVYANGMAAESYMDVGNRGHFSHFMGEAVRGAPRDREAVRALFHGQWRRIAAALPKRPAIAAAR